MTRIFRIVRIAAPALALLAAACSDHPSAQTGQASQTSANVDTYGPGITPTAPNFNNPYATDPLDPNMNPHYRTGVH